MSTPNQHTTDFARPDPITGPGREGRTERPVDAAHADTAYEGTAEEGTVHESAGHVGAGHESAGHESAGHESADHRNLGHGGAATSTATDAYFGTGAVGPDASRTPDTPALRDGADSDRPAVPTSRADPSGTDAEGREQLVPRDRADDYGSRWDAVKGTFVDEPRQAVRAADELVGELLDELEGLFRKQRQSLEHGLDADETSTEDLRLALRRYRSFFDRLLSL